MFQQQNSVKLFNKAKKIRFFQRMW